MMDVNIDGIRYHVESCGDGFPLLLLHGFTGDSSTWTSFCSKWGKHSKLIMPDLLGHGKTDAPDDYERYNIESAANDLNQILEDLGIEKVDLLGYSMGGRLGLTFAILFPEKIRKVVLESTSPGLSSEKERKDRRMKDEDLAHFIKEKGIEMFVNYWEKIPLFATMENLPNHVKEKVRKQRLSHSQAGLSNSLIGMGTGAQPSWWENLQQLEGKILLLTGEKDEKFCRIAEQMQKELKNASWITVENSGHAIHVEETEKFGTIVSEFLLNS